MRGHGRLARARRRLRRGGPAVDPGGFDRTHDGLISGWFVCTACRRPPTPTPDLRCDGRPQAVIKAATPRSDVPGGSGFVLRFPARGGRPPRVRVQCPRHPEHGMEIDAPREDWQVTTLGMIEHAFWPIVSGWLAQVGADDRPVTLLVGDLPAVTVDAAVPRPDVAVYLGEPGVAGFHVDLAARLRYAQPDGLPVRLVHAGQVLGAMPIRESPLIGDDRWLPPPGGNPLPGPALAALARRVQQAEVDLSSGDWRALLTRLGSEDHSPEAEQWARFLAHRGMTPAEVAGWLALRGAHSHGVPALNPLPASLTHTLEVGPPVPPRVQAWTEPLLGLPAGIAGATPASPPAPPSPPPPTHAPPHARPAPPPASPHARRVAVAGLVHHRSGLGQNADNSLRALTLAGIPADPAGFIPGLGGWNPRLAATSEAAASCGARTVLLHLPVDRVIPGLTAQPALLATDRLIGYFMWEIQTVPAQFHRALDVVDEIWTATEFVADAFRAVTDTPVHVTGHAVDVEGIIPVDRAEVGVTDDAFLVHLSVDANSTIARKNPNDAIDAFRLAFGDDPRTVLLVKIRNYPHVIGLARSGDPHARGLLRRLAEHRNVRAVVGEWPRRRALGLIAAADCYLSLHRAEGFGYTIAEALLLGTPVVATDYSGCTELLTDARAHPVGYTLVDLHAGEYFYWEPGMHWAQPDLAAAAAHLSALHAAWLAGQPTRGIASPQTVRACALTTLGERYRELLDRG